MERPRGGRTLGARRTPLIGCFRSPEPVCRRMSSVLLNGDGYMVSLIEHLKFPVRGEQGITC